MKISFQNVVAYILGCFSFNHFAMTRALSQEVVSSDGYQLSLSVSTFNHNTLLLAGQQWWPTTTHSLLFQIQQEALSAASPSLRTTFFLSYPLSPAAVSSFQTE